MSQIVTGRPVIQKGPRWVSMKLRKSAYMKPCTMHSPMCNGNPETTCWCHSDHEEHGKGVGIKSHDIFGFYGCSGCHIWYDIVSRQDGVPNEERRASYQKAHDKSMVIAVTAGVLK